MTFNYGEFGSELFYGSIISFWLIYHIINLLRFSVRLVVRFIAQVSVFTVDEAMVIEGWWWFLQVRVCDISKRGFHSIRIYHCICQKEKNWRLICNPRDYHARVKVMLFVFLRLLMVGATAFNFQFHEADKREFYQYIYDRINHNLPKE